MKSKKKLLLLGVGAMGALALGVGATSTFAWFQATSAATISAVTNGENSSIRVANHAEVAGINMRIKLIWSALPNVDLTAGAAKAAAGESVEQVIGNSYVIDANGNVKPNTSASVVKVQTANLTLSTTASEIETDATGAGGWRASTAEERDLLNGKVVTVKLAASDQLRIMADGELTNGAVGAYTAGTEVTLGTATISSSSGSVSYAYDSVYDINDATADAGLNFRYSASPKDDDGTTGEATDVSYGTLTVTFTVA